VCRLARAKNGHTLTLIFRPDGLSPLGTCFAGARTGVVTCERMAEGDGERQPQAHWREKKHHEDRLKFCSLASPHAPDRCIILPLNAT